MTPPYRSGSLSSNYSLWVTYFKLISPFSFLPLLLLLKFQVEFWNCESMKQTDCRDWKSNATNLWNRVIYKLMKLKWLLIRNYSYHIENFHTLVQKMLSHTGWVFSHLLDRECVCVHIFPLREKGFFGVLWGPCRSNSQFDLARFLSYVLVMTYPKIIILGLVVSEEIGVKVFRYFFALSFIR